MNLQRAKWRKRLLLSAACVVGVLMVLVVAAYLLAVREPADYRPPQLSPVQQEKAEKRGLQKSADFYNNYHLNAPFSIAFEQQLLNDLLVLDDTKRLLQRLSGRASDRITQIQLAFDEGSVRIMGRVWRGESSFVLTVILELQLTEQGQLQIDLAGVKIGTLRLPETLVREKLAALAGRFASATVRMSRTGQARGNTNSRTDLTEELYERLAVAIEALAQRQQVTMSAIIEDADEHGQHAQITDIAVRPGRIELEVLPLLDS